MRLLIIGTLHGQVGAASKIARDRGAKITLVENITQALEHLRGGKGADLILIDVKEDIGLLVSSLKQERIHVPVVGCGFETSTEDAVRAIKAGAKEYLPLPPDAELIAAVLEAIAEEHHSLIYGSEPMKQMIAIAEQIAPSDASVLITGESGTGKEVIARFIHAHSRRKNNTLVSVNCAAIPETLLESELFGHEKGAFTGANARRIGKFEEANGGTLFLDEISEMDVRLQAKLLRVIQERVIDRVGGSSSVKVDIRILASSNRNLRDAVAKGQFREDLFFRLNVINLQLPPLRDRREDIVLLAEFFIRKYAEANGVPVRPLADDVLTRLLNYTWPGNVRELENTMHRAVLLSTGNDIGNNAIMLSGEVAPAPAVTASSDPQQMGGLVGRTVESVERDLILGTLDHCLGNRTHAANILGISIRTLRNKLKLYEEGK
jgi:two-component system response regulator FlrC